MEVFVYALSMFSNSLMIIKLDRNTLQLCQMFCGKYYFNISAFLNVTVCYS